MAATDPPRTALILPFTANPMEPACLEPAATLADSVDIYSRDGSAWRQSPPLTGWRLGYAGSHCLHRRIPA